MLYPRVAILTPIYNAALFIHRLARSIVEQTYPNIKWYVVNDGSMDNSVEIIESYRSALENRGYELIVIHQENQGLAKTINNALKKIDGDYLIWPDADDWFAEKTTIETFVNALNGTTDEVGMVRSAINLVDEKTLKTTEVLSPYPLDGKDMFDYFVRWKHGVFTNPGAWMIKLKFIDEIIPDREIVTTQYAGQKAQLLWPYLFYKKGIVINKPRVNYFIREESHSRNLFKGLHKKIRQQEDHLTTFVTTLQGIKGLNNEQKEYYIRFQKSRIYHKICPMCYQNEDSKAFQTYFKLWKNEQTAETITFKLYCLFLLSYIPYAFIVIRKVKKILRG